MFTKLANVGLLGWDCTGDFGDLTVYDSRKQKTVFFPRAPPLNPPTPAQESNRDRFRDAAEQWQQTTPQYRADVQRLARAASLRITGYNLYTWQCFQATTQVWDTICRQSGLNVEPPAFLG